MKSDSLRDDEEAAAYKEGYMEGVKEALEQQAEVLGARVGYIVGFAQSVDVSKLSERARARVLSLREKCDSIPRSSIKEVLDSALVLEEYYRQCLAVMKIADADPTKPESKAEMF